MSHAAIVRSNEHNQQKKTWATLAAAARKLAREDDRAKHMMRWRRGDPKCIAQWFDRVWMDFMPYMKPKLNQNFLNWTLNVYEFIHSSPLRTIFIPSTHNKHYQSFNASYFYSCRCSSTYKMVSPPLSWKSSSQFLKPVDANFQFNG